MIEIAVLILGSMDLVTSVLKKRLLSFSAGYGPTGATSGAKLANLFKHLDVRFAVDRITASLTPRCAASLLRPTLS